MIGVLNNFTVGEIGRFFTFKRADLSFSILKLAISILTKPLLQYSGHKVLDKKNLQLLQKKEPLLHSRLVKLIKKVRLFSKQLGIKKEISFLLSDQEGVFDSYSGLFNLFSPAIVVSKKIYENPVPFLNENEEEFAVYHELTHLKNQHSLLLPLLFLSEVIFNVVFYQIFPTLTFFYWAVKNITQFIAVVLIDTVFYNRFEESADLQAALYVGKSGGISLYEKLSQHKLVNS